MPDLASRISLTGPPPDSPEDFLSSALSTLDPDDATDIHGDAEHGLLYTSPHLPKPLRLDLADPNGDEDRKLFSHYLWNSSLLLAELVEAGTLGLDAPASGALSMGTAAARDFDVRGKSVMELGAGTALPSLAAALLGADKVVVTDYPAPVVLDTLQENVQRNAQADFSPAAGGVARSVVVEGHAWGELSTPSAKSGRRAFDRVFAADCLWMPWQHDNLRRSLGWFLKDDADARAWVVAGFHTGRGKMKGFFEPAALGEQGLELERIWERDVAGNEREWVDVRPGEDSSKTKRWLVVAVLRRKSQ